MNHEFNSLHRLDQPSVSKRFCPFDSTFAPKIPTRAPTLGVNFGPSGSRREVSHQAASPAAHHANCRTPCEGGARGVAKQTNTVSTCLTKKRKRHVSHKTSGNNLFPVPRNVGLDHGDPGLKVRRLEPQKCAAVFWGDAVQPIKDTPTCQKSPLSHMPKEGPSWTLVIWVVSR